MEDRQAPPQTKQNSCSFSWIFSTGGSTLHLHSPVLNKAGWHFYTISQTGKQRTSSTAEAIESSTFLSPYSPIHGRNRVFSVFKFDGKLSLYSSAFPSCCYPKSSAGDAQKHRKKPFLPQEAFSGIPNTPSHPTQTPQAHPRLQKWADNAVISNNYMVHEVHFILHPRETKSSYIGNGAGIQTPSCSNMLSYSNSSPGATLFSPKSN